MQTPLAVPRYINEISDGQRRRCQLLECLAIPRSVYLMDEITSDLDLYAREALLGLSSLWMLCLN